MKNITKAMLPQFAGDSLLFTEYNSVIKETLKDMNLLPENEYLFNILMNKRRIIFFK